MRARKCADYQYAMGDAIGDDALYDVIVVACVGKVVCQESRDVEFKE